MKEITAYKTQDGTIYESFHKATRHAEKEYGEGLLKLSSKLLQMEKYTAMSNFLDENLESFVELAKLKKDIELEPIEDDDWRPK
jgi:hypothetical protein